ncbi:MAG: hypothetical protein P1U40_07155 [Coxiellaceae bacterium]|nr:hypothetical protein [Coxiellaceae bacterium]
MVQNNRQYESKETRGDMATISTESCNQLIQIFHPNFVPLDSRTSSLIDDLLDEQVATNSAQQEQKVPASFRDIRGDTKTVDHEEYKLLKRQAAEMQQLLKNTYTSFTNKYNATYSQIQIESNSLDTMCKEERYKLESLVKDLRACLLKYNLHLSEPDDINTLDSAITIINQKFESLRRGNKHNHVFNDENAFYQDMLTLFKKHNFATKVYTKHCKLLSHGPTISSHRFKPENGKPCHMTDATIAVDAKFSQKHFPAHCYKKDQMMISPIGVQSDLMFKIIDIMEINHSLSRLMPEIGTLIQEREALLDVAEKLIELNKKTDAIKSKFITQHRTRQQQHCNGVRQARNRRNTPRNLPGGTRQANSFRQVQNQKATITPNLTDNDKHLDFLIKLITQLFPENEDQLNPVFERNFHGRKRLCCFTTNKAPKHIRQLRQLIWQELDKSRDTPKTALIAAIQSNLIDKTQKIKLIEKCKAILDDVTLTAENTQGDYQGFFARRICGKQRNNNTANFYRRFKSKIEQLQLPAASTLALTPDSSTFT